MCSIFSFAQEINGTIVDEFGNALPGINLQPQILMEALLFKEVLANKLNFQ